MAESRIVFPSWPLLPASTTSPPDQHPRWFSRRLVTRLVGTLVEWSQLVATSDQYISGLSSMQVSHVHKPVQRALRVDSGIIG